MENSLGCFERAILHSPREFTILGIDPGTSHLGLCFMDVCFDSLTIKNIQTKTLKAHKPFYFQQINHWMLETHSEKSLRIRELANQFSDVINEIRPLYVAVEAPFISMQTASAFAPLVECIKTLEDVLYSCFPFKPFFRIDTITAKRNVYPEKQTLITRYKELVKNKASSKEKVLFCVQSHPELRKHLNEKMDEHSIDAMVIAYAMLCKVRAGDFSF